MVTDPMAPKPERVVAAKTDSEHLAEIEITLKSINSKLGFFVFITVIAIIIQVLGALV